MKKLITVIIAVFLALNLTACENKNDGAAYEMGDILKFGKYEWIVLDVDAEEGRVLLLSEKIVT